MVGDIELEMILLRGVAQRIKRRGPRQSPGAHHMGVKKHLKSYYLVKPSVFGLKDRV